MSTLDYLIKYINYIFDKNDKFNGSFLCLLKEKNNMNIYKRKDGRLEGRIFLGKDRTGKRKYRSYYGLTVDEIESKYNTSQRPLEISIAITEMTVSELAAEWLMLVQNRIKASTYAN